MSTTRGVHIPKLRGFYKWLGIATGIGLAIRLAYVLFTHPGIPLSGDPWYYNWQAYDLTKGHGLIDPQQFLYFGKAIPGSDHPPVTTLLLATLDLYRLSSPLAHQIAYCFLGAVTVVVTGLAAREIAGDHAGILAGFVAAAYPELWINDGLSQSETPAQLFAAVTILLAYRFWKRPGFVLAGGLGMATALWVLTRSEDFLMFPLVVIPLAYGAREPSALRGAQFGAPALDSTAWGLTIKPVRRTAGVGRYLRRFWTAATSWGTGDVKDPRRLLPSRSRILLGATSAALFVLLVAPWSLHTLTAYSHPEIISTQLGRTLVGANCPDTYSGPLIGYWSYACQLDNPPPASDDASQQDAFYRTQATQYAQHHLKRLVPVVYARLGRVWGFYNPGSNLSLDSLQERPYWASLLGLIMYYVMIIPALAALLMLRRRRVAISPLLGPFISVTVIAVLTYGTTRFRACVEPGLVILFAIGQAGWGRRLAESGQVGVRGMGRRFRTLLGIPDDGSTGPEPNEADPSRPLAGSLSHD